MDGSGIRVARFDELSAATLYALLRLRVQVFVVEQECAYAELDGRDSEPGTLHVWTEDAEGPTAYLRIVEEPHGGARIGRVCTRDDQRGTGLAARLVVHAVGLLDGREVVLHAQSHLVGWYLRLGFEPDGHEFVEDGIPHTPMRRTPTLADGRSEA